MADVTSIKALAFDVFGTVVDLRGPIARAARELGRAKGLDAVDWEGLAEAWRARYIPATQRVRAGRLPWTRLDDLNRLTLEETLAEFGVSLAEDDVERLLRAWHALDAWPDAVEGLARLRRRFIVATLSNGNVAMLVDVSRHAGLTWDCILSAELVRHYKPDPEVYRMAAEILGLQPPEVMMVAAHEGDLVAARRVGLRTGLVSRPSERGPTANPEGPLAEPFDVVAADFLDLAAKLGA